MTIAQQRAAAEQRAHALLRSIVPEDEWRWRVERDLLGRIRSRVPTHLEFLGQSGRYTYRIHFSQTSENIERFGNGESWGLCGGPNPFGDYVVIGRYGPDFDHDAYSLARTQAIHEGCRYVPQLPKYDIWLGQYLALKYDEEAFLEAANVF